MTIGHPTVPLRRPGALGGTPAGARALWDSRVGSNNHHEPSDRGNEAGYRGDQTCVRRNDTRVGVGRVQGMAVRAVLRSDLELGEVQDQQADPQCEKEHPSDDTPQAGPFPSHALMVGAWSPLVLIAIVVASAFYGQ